MIEFLSAFGVLDARAQFRLSFMEVRISQRLGVPFPASNTPSLVVARLFAGAAFVFRPAIPAVQLTAQAQADGRAQEDL